MLNSKVIEVSSCLAACAALCVIGLVCCEAPPRFDRALHGAIGQALAKETLSLLGPSGKVTVISRDTESFAQPALQILLKSFRRELRQAKVAEAGTQMVQTDPLRPLDVPSGDFFELLRRTPPESVIVSLLGPPLLTAAQRSSLPQARAKVVAFCPGPIGEALDLRQLFSAGLLHAAVISAPAQLSGAAHPPKTFDQLYRTVRATDYATISSAALAPLAAHE
jgi:hypothetical protein